MPRPGAADGGAAKPTIINLNLEIGLPTVAEALDRLQARLNQARIQGASVVRVIHGWGSTVGGGGKIRQAARQWLLKQQASGQVRTVLFGDHYTHTETETKILQRRYPELTRTEPQDRHNPGITFVEL